jgi:hypothetical protein
MGEWGVGISPRLTGEGSPLLFRTKRGGGTHPELLGKEEGEAEDWGKRKFQAQCMRDYWSPLLSRSILPKGSIGALEPRGDFHYQATETMMEA